MDRSYQKIQEKHLAIFRSLAFKELDQLLNKVGGGRYKVYENKLISICLCQGVAQHFVENKSVKTYDYIDYVAPMEIEEKGFKVCDDGQVLSGIKDVDIWFFFEEDNDVKIPDIKNMRKTIVEDLPEIGITKIDFLKKAIGKTSEGFTSSMPKESVIKYITSSQTTTASYLRRKSVVGLHPTSISGEILWAVKRLAKKQ